MVNGIFNNPAFGLESLTASILEIPFMPTKARSLGIFRNEGIATTTVDLEFDAVKAALIPYTQRGEEATPYEHGKRTVRSLKVPHLQLRSTIKPESIQNVRMFGSTNQLASAEAVVKQRMEGLTVSHDATLEYQSIGAIKGVIYDADGTTVLYDLFSEFQVNQTSIDFTLGDANAKMKPKCLAVVRAIEDALGAGRVFDHVHAFCGAAWFDAFTTHPDVEEAYKRWQDAAGQQGAFLRNDNRRGFEFGGIFFEEYTGSVSGVPFVPTGQAHFFPVGVPGLFVTNFAPANMMEAVNTIGLPRYARGEPMEFGRGLKLLTESNPLAYCTQPKTLVKGTSSNGLP
jgi:hypothetical protein